MVEKYPLFEEINRGNNHVCVCSDHTCNFCMTKIRFETEPEPDLNVSYILPAEVALHNQPHDVWISFLGKVFNITSLVKNYQDDKSVLPLLAFAGKDVSQWFNPHSGDIQHFIHPITGVKIPYCPHGHLPDVRTVVPDTNWEPVPEPPWWQNKSYLVGYLTKKGRYIRIQNMLSRDICQIQVCMEDKIKRIQQRYLMFNADNDSYTWCYDDRVLDLELTLEQNDIPDEKEKFVSIGLPENTYIPLLMIYYNDDLKWDENGIKVL